MDNAIVNEGNSKNWAAIAEINMFFTGDIVWMPPNITRVEFTAEGEKKTYLEKNAEIAAKDHITSRMVFELSCAIVCHSSSPNAASPVRR